MPASWAGWLACPLPVLGVARAIAGFFGAACFGFFAVSTTTMGGKVVGELSSASAEIGQPKQSRPTAVPDANVAR